MATLAEISTMVDETTVIMTSIDTGLAALATLIANLRAGQVSQAEIDALAVKVEELKVKAQVILNNQTAIQ